MTKHSETNAEFIQFYDEVHPQTDETTPFDPKQSESKGWKVIIADDEEAVHTMTKMVVRNFQFEGKPLIFLSAYSGEETLHLLREHPDTAVILLDVVMETENAGLEVAKGIREDLGNDMVRIILRTGQSGQAPENEVIVNYDINDYKEKTELSVQKLNTMMISSLRTYRDIVRLKESEKALLRAKMLAEEANVAKSQFLANMSHELRTPLNGIMVTAQLLKTTPLDVEQVDYVDMLLDSTKRLLPIVNDVLDFSKLEAGKMTFRHHRFNMSSMVKSLSKTFIPLAKDKDLEFKYELDPELPKALCGDSGKLRQILTNLVGNAIKFTNQGTIKLAVKIHSQNADLMKLHFSVLDTGIGVASQDVQSIFNAFTQADGSHTRDFGGTGLGLAISKQIVEHMNGEIWVDSRSGKGSTFHFTTDLINGYCPFITSEDLDPNSFDEVFTLEKLKGLNILIAEDDLINRKVMESLLVNVGCTVEISSNGVDVLKKMENPCYDVILMDVSMPEVDGYEATKQIRENLAHCSTHIPIIAISAYDAMDVKEECANAGMDGFISKPIKSEELYQMISELL